MKNKSLKTIILLFVGIFLLSNYFENSILRVVAGLVYIFYFPGNLLINVLNLTGGTSIVKRIFISITASFLIVSSEGILLNFSPFHLKSWSILIAITLSITVLVAIDFVKNRFKWNSYKRVSSGEKLRNASQPKFVFFQENPLITSFSIGVSLLVLIVILSLSYIRITNVPSKERFTEFYFINSSNVSLDSVDLGKGIQKGNIDFGVINQEGKPTEYHVDLIVDDVKVDTVEPHLLSNREKWEGEVHISGKLKCNSCEIFLLLYKTKDLSPYRTLKFSLSKNN